MYRAVRDRPARAALLAAVCAAASPVAGVLLALAGLTYALARARRVPAGLARAGRAGVVPLGLLFAEGGFEPYPPTSFAATALVRSRSCGRSRAGAPAADGGGRLPAGVRAARSLIHTPMGSNIERYGVLLAGPLLLCALAGSAAADGRRPRGRARRGPRSRPVAAAGGRRRAASAVPVSPSRGWRCADRRVDRVGAGARDGAVAGSKRRGVVLRAGRALPARPRRRLERVEVPLTRSHWEAALLAPRVSLARGWEKQLDERYDSVLLGPG